MNLAQFQTDRYKADKTYIILCDQKDREGFSHT
jgi:hypothetical protein